MKKFTLYSSVFLLLFALIPGAMAASVVMEPVEKEGFLSTEKCAAAGELKDCYLENYACGSDDCFKKIEAGTSLPVTIVLYSHKEGHTYIVDVSKLKPSEIDEGINRNEVTIVGEYDKETNTIMATEFRAPPPPKKSFFKGCL